MKRNKENYTNSDNIADSIDLMEDAIDLSVHKQYIDLSAKIDFDRVEYKEVLKESEKLFSKNTPIEAKKMILLLLAHFGTIDSYRAIERYLRLPKNNLRDWALLSLKECGMFLQSSFLGEEGGVVSTGLGGKKNKMRYYFTISTKEGLPFSATHRDILSQGFKTIAHQFESDIEEMFFGREYAVIKILIPIDVAVGNVIEEGIIECNKKQEFLFFSYYVTNVKKPTNEEILQYLREVGKEYQ